MIWDWRCFRKGWGRRLVSDRRWKFQRSKAWRNRWREGDFPRSYSPQSQRFVDAEFWRMQLEGEGIPGGSTGFQDE